MQPITCNRWACNFCHFGILQYLCRQILAIGGPASFVTLVTHTASITFLSSVLKMRKDARVVWVTKDCDISLMQKNIKVDSPCNGNYRYIAL